MNRRAFLSSLAAGSAGLVLPEPRRVRTYSFMPGVGRERVYFDGSRDFLPTSNLPVPSPGQRIAVYGPVIIRGLPTRDDLIALEAAVRATYGPSIEF